MSSTPMDLDRPSGASSNGPSLNIQRSLGGTSSVSNLSDVMSSFRPTKVSVPRSYHPPVSRELVLHLV